MQKRRDLYKKLSKKNKDFIENYLENILKLPKEKWEEFLFPEYDKHLFDYSKMKDMERAVERFINALEKEEKICIYGDYDCDGVPGVAMFRDFLEKLNYKNVIYYIPHRHKEGYGLNNGAIEKLAKEKVKLLITIDLGITNIKEIGFANELGIDVIITDHHLPIENEDGQILPKAFAIINNKQSGCNYEFKELCGSGTVWKFILGIMEELRKRPSSVAIATPSPKEKDANRYPKYNSKLIETAKSHRKEQTESEEHCWNLVRNRNLKYKFVRQKVVDNFILDFYCSKLMLGIEIDGEYHDEEFQKQYDIERENVIKNHKIKLLRIKNEEMLQLDEIKLLEKINLFKNELDGSFSFGEGGQRPDEGLKNLPNGYEKWLLDMVGVATIADLVPLKEENRVLAIYGMHVLSQTKRQGLRKIFKKGSVNLEKVNETDIAFTLAPRINAASRMAHPEVALRMLSTDLVESLSGAEELENLNKERKESVATIMKKVHKQLEERLLNGLLPKIVVIGDRDWGAGVLGLIASQIVDKYNVNAFVWGGGEIEQKSSLNPSFNKEGQASSKISNQDTKNNKEEFKGSCRSNGEVHMVKLMTDAEKLFTHFGGHEMSGGFAINLQNIFELEKALNEIYNRDNKTHIEKKLEKVEEKTLQIYLEEITSELLDALSLIGPFGAGNPQPNFQIINLRNISIERFGKNKEHLKMKLTAGEERKTIREAIKFYVDEKLEEKINSTNWSNLKFSVEAGFNSSIPRLKLII